MKLALLFIGLLAALGLVAYLLDALARKKPAHTPEDTPPTPRPADGECCGRHAICERDSLLAGVSRHIEYYDDEELDRFRGTPSDAYRDEDLEAFREVLYTMHTEEVPGWVRSLQLRGVEMPDALKDEIILIVGELRARPDQS